MKHIFLALTVGFCSVGAILLQACGGDEATTKDGGMDAAADATVDDTGQPMDGSMDDTMGMDTGTDGSMMGDGGGTGPNPGKVNCGTMVECDAGGNGCCIRFQDGGLNFSCQPMGQCGGIRWECDEPADCMQGICCISTFNNVVDKNCQQFCGGSVRACKQNTDCPDAGACNTYTCPGNVTIQSCTKPQNCN